VAEGMAQIQQGMAEWRAIGQELEWPEYLALLAEAHAKAGHANDGLAVLREARAAIDRTGERCWDAEVYRLHAELSLQTSGAEDAAEASFLSAIGAARRQNAKSFELRAVTGLSRLWQRQGKKDEARQMLGEVYGWFTEGFDTADLRDARARLEELA